MAGSKHICKSLFDANKNALMNVKVNGLGFLLGRFEPLYDDQNRHEPKWEVGLGFRRLPGLES